ncbi:lysylphosphatidylglycerol synthase domain-containing protein [Cellulomonas sp. PS-H5]|uniref:lysylphosphatidylglycerol synthase domain-containing protein n=1 Tax=Cellulomonas sp. PS-H5 TaxID=2820400 RepID=UPI001C4FD178|nr:lysylphosphatidylglycerol synthase domain-containing protein [Cellulomonas sp. PS-H5]MBW0254599.1 flippase-like domain-containing protein [Cellulomonas sp. PS-H5]
MRSRRAVVGAVFFALAAGLLVWSVVTRREELAHALTRLTPATVVLSLVLACAGLVAQMLSWRSMLAATGAPPPLAAAARIYFHGQLGKYVPGGVWAVVAQAELGRAHRVGRARSAVVALGALAVLLVVGGAVAVVGLAAGSPGSLSTYWWAVAVVPLGVVGLLPPVFDRVVALGLRLTRRGDQQVRVAGPGLARSAGWALVMWLLFGLHAAVLVHDLAPASASRSVVLGTGAFALAWVVGFLVVVAPAGTGPREAALVLALAPVLGSADALLVALVSRVLMVVADAGAAGVAAAVGRRRVTAEEPAGTGSA